MKFRYIVASLIVFLFLFSGVASATTYNWGEGDLFQALKGAFSTGSNGHHHDGTDSRRMGETTENPTFATNVVASGHKTGVTTNVSTESNLTSAALGYGVIAMQGNIAAKNITIASGVKGQMVTIYMSQYNGANITIGDFTATPITKTGWSTIVFSAVNQKVTLLWLDDTYGWVLVGQPTAGVFHTLSSGTVTATTTVTAGTTVSAGTTVTAGTGVTATTGNIAATAGAVSAGTTVAAGTTVTGGTGVTATTGDVAASAGNVTAATDVKFRTSVYAVGNKTGVTTNVSTESNLTSAALAYGVIKLEAGSAKTISIANGTKGQMVTLIMTVYDAGDITLTDDGLAAGSVFTKTGWDDITFNAVGDQVTLLYVDDTVGWTVVGYYGVVIAQ